MCSARGRFYLWQPICIVFHSLAFHPCLDDCYLPEPIDLPRYCTGTMLPCSLRFPDLVHDFHTFRSWMDTIFCNKIIELVRVWGKFLTLMAVRSRDRLLFRRRRNASEEQLANKCLYACGCRSNPGYGAPGGTRGRFRSLVWCMEGNPTGSSGWQLRSYSACWDGGINRA